MPARGKAGLLALTLVVVLWGVGVLPAVAHTSLAEATPAIGRETDRVSEIVLEFAGALAPGETHAIRLSAPDSETVVAEGDAEVRGDRTIALAVDAELPGNGQYVIDWAIVAADGDDQASRYAFTYTGAETDFASPTAEVSPASDGRSTPVWALAVGGVMVGLLLVLVRRQVSARRPERAAW